MSNILTAIDTLIKSNEYSVGQFQHSSNRMNNMGESLENYIKMIFSGRTTQLNEEEKLLLYSQKFSYSGNQNNPPDLILKNGDAIEIKKFESSNTQIALNSSYPKSKLYSSSPMITQACRECEDTPWEEKDILYIFGHLSRGILKSLWMIYGDCFSAEKSIYEELFNKVSGGIRNIENIDFSETKELGRVNNVDPLGITNLRIRGMWQLQNPKTIFNYLDLIDNGSFNLNVIMKEEKFNSFSISDRKNAESAKHDGYSFRRIKIKNPNNPVKLLDSILINYKIS